MPGMVLNLVEDHLSVIGEEHVDAGKSLAAQGAVDGLGGLLDEIAGLVRDVGGNDEGRVLRSGLGRGLLVDAEEPV